MSLSRLGFGAIALLLVTACAEGAQGPGGTGSGGAGAGQGGATSVGGAGHGGSGQGGDAVGQGGDGTPSSTHTTGSGGSGDGGGPTTTTSSTSTTTTDASTSQSSTSSGVDPGTIYFSEYVEGEGNDKALEIYNAGSTPIDLGDCHLDRYQNGASSAAPPVPIDDGSLAPGAVFVICQSNFSDGGACDKLTADIQHSGDDAVALVCGGETKDVFGKIGEDPGSEWGSGNTSSADNTLRRKCSVTEGDTNGNDSFNPADEWDGAGLGNFDDLGQYDCP